MVKFKLRNFLLRFFPVITAMLLIVLCAFPAFAAPPVSTFIAPIFFDEVAFLYGEAFERSYRMPYPGNIMGPVNPGADYVQYKNESSSFDNSFYITGIDVLDNGKIRSNYRLSYDYTGWGVGLFNVSGTIIDTPLLSSSTGYHVSFSQGTVGVSGRVSISFTAAKINTSSDSYSIQTKSFSASNVSFGDGGIDLMHLIDSALTDLSYRDGDYVYLPTLSVRFFFDDYDLTEVLMHTEVVRRTSPRTYTQWFNQYELNRSVIVNPADPSDVNFVDWLQTAIGGFLDFQLWPGMSLNEIMWVILVVGVLFWFFKVTV